jgi:hypothetical protein
LLSKYKSDFKIFLIIFFFSIHHLVSFFLFKYNKLALQFLINDEDNKYFKFKTKSESVKFVAFVDVYNRLMFKMAQTCDIESIGFLFKRMSTKTNPVDPDIYSYAAVLACLGRMLNQLDLKREKTLLVIKNVINDIHKKVN